jgi:hypothetical protein
VHPACEAVAAAMSPSSCLDDRDSNGRSQSGWLRRLSGPCRVRLPPYICTGVGPYGQTRQHTLEHRPTMSQHHPCSSELRQHLITQQLDLVESTLGLYSQNGQRIRASRQGEDILTELPWHWARRTRFHYRIRIVAIVSERNEPPGCPFRRLGVPASSIPL